MHYSVGIIHTFVRLIIKIMKAKICSILAASLLLFLGCTNDDPQTPLPPVPEENEVPALPTDPQPDNISFNHTIMLLQHTGTA